MRKALFTTALFSVFLIAPIWLTVSSRYETHLVAEKNAQTEEQLIQQANTLSNAIQKRFALLEGLNAFVLANPQQEQLNAKFATFAAALHAGAKGIRNFGLAPGGVNGYVYPLKDNEKVIGHSLTNDPRPNVKADVQRAIRSQKITLSGPYLLRQGGLGLVARKAVFQGDEFWGLATMVVDMPPVLAEAGLGGTAIGSAVAIRKAGGEYFYGNRPEFAHNPLTKRIDLPDGYWELVTQPDEMLTASLAKQLNIFRAISSFAALLLMLLIFSITSRQAYLTERVKAQTRDLEAELSVRRKTEQALLESEERFRELIEHSPIGLALCRMDGSLVSVNSAYAKIIGYSADEIPALSYWDITPETYAAQEKMQLEQLEKLGRYGPYEKEYRHKDGHLVPVRLNGMIVRRDGEDFIWSSVEDISALRASEIEKNELEAQLRQSQKMEAIGTLAGGVAHDFNNILSAIIGYAELSLRNPNCDVKINRNLNYVLAAAGRARDLVRQILMFSRKGERKLEPVKIHTLVLEAGKLLRKTIPTNISIQLDIDTNTGTVLADTTQIHQIVMNLCTNAFHSISEQGGEISISLKPVQVDTSTSQKYSNLRQGEYALLTISDTGTGIPPEVLPRIFDPFFTTKKQDQGTGMGLAVVHGAVQNHDGAIGVESVFGQGTKFKVFIPLTTAAADEQKTATDPFADISGKGNILWVDDETMLAELGKEILEAVGYRVTTMTSALDAWNIFQASPDIFDLIVTDQTMPAMTGDVLAQKALQLRADIPIIICTGHSSILDAEKARAIGVKAILMKPLESSVLLNEVRKVLNAQTG